MALIANLKTNKKAIFNTSWLIFEKVGILAIGLLTSIFVARHLEPEGFGVISLGLAVAAFIDPIASLGMNSILAREIVRKSRDESVIVKTAIAFRSMAAIVAMIFTIATLIIFWKPENENVMLMVVLAAFSKLFSSFNALRYWFEAHTNAKFLVKYSIVQTLLFSLIKILAVFYAGSLKTFIYIFALEIAASSLVLVIPYLAKQNSRFSAKIDYAYGISIIKQSGWLLFSGIASIIYLKIDQIMLGTMLGPKEVGVYAVAARFSEVWYFLPTAIMSSMFPGLIRARDSDSMLYSNKLQTLIDILFWAAFLIAAVMTALSHDFINLLYGYEFKDAGNILAIHVWAGLFVFMRAVLSKWLIIEGILAFSLITHGIGAFVNVALNILLIPSFAGEGAAIATLFSYASAAWLALFVSSRTRAMGYKMALAPFAPFRLLLKRFHQV